MIRTIIMPAAFVFMSVALFATGHLSSIAISSLVSLMRGDSELLVGIMTALPFVGLLVGSIVMPRLLRRTRHVRLFAISAAGCALTLLFLPQIDSPLVWALLRLAYGFFAAGVWLCCDTWMAVLPEPQHRGKTMAVYQVIVLSGTALGQLLLVTAGDNSSLGVNIATAAMIAAVIPVCCTRLAEPPRQQKTSNLPLRLAWRISPLALFGAFSAGLCFSSYSTILLSLSRQGVVGSQLAALGTLMLLAGIAGQFGVGYLSDRFGNRRRIMQLVIVACIVALSGAAVLQPSTQWGWLLPTICLYGALVVTIYPLSIALGGDLVSPENYQPFVAKTFLAIMTGNAMGPFLGSMFMSASARFGIFLFLVLVLAMLLAASASRRFMARHKPIDTEEMAPVALMGNNPEYILTRGDPGKDQDTAEPRSDADGDGAR